MNEQKFDDSEHHEFSSSSSPRWLVCHGSVKEIRKLPKKLQQGRNSYASKEGTVAHKLCEKGLKGEDITYQLDKTINSVIVDDIMVEHCLNYISYVKKLVKKYKKKYGKKNVELHVEYYKNLSPHFNGESVGGTSDVLIVVKGKFVHVIDFKYGKQHVVGAEFNTQLMMYGISKILGIKKKTLKKLYEKIIFTIIQPRGFHEDGTIRTSEMKPLELLKWCDEVAKVAIEACLEDDAVFVAGEAQCIWCPLAGTCKAFEIYASSSAKQEFTELMDEEQLNPKLLSNEEVSTIIQNKSLIVSWLNSVEEHAVHNLEHEGKEFKGIKLVAKRSRRRFTASDMRIKSAMVKFHLPDDIMYQKKIRSPNQLEIELTKHIGRERAVKFISGFTEKPYNGVTIAKSDDKRQQVFGSAEQEFSEYVN